MSFLLAFAGAVMSAIYEEKKDEDGFLYVTYSGENTFGYQNCGFNFQLSAKIWFTETSI